MKVRREVVFATRNSGKLRELERMVAGLPYRFRTLADFPDAPPVVEDRQTFVENAALKALSAFAATGRWALADDSGLCVDALDGAPGVHSSSYGGVEGDNARNNARLLKEMAHITDPPRRSAHFRATLVLLGPAAELGAEALSGDMQESLRSVAGCPPDVALHVFEGRSHGTILFAPRGDDGFGYDPLFASVELPDDQGELLSRSTFGELPLARKNEISHRGRAMQALVAFLRGFPRA